MKFPGKKRRESAADTDRNIKFDDFDWNVQKEEGWFNLVVMNAKSEPTKNGGEQIIVHFGIQPGGEPPFPRVTWWVPFSYQPKVEMLMSVLMPEFADQEDDVDFDPKSLMFRTCAGLIEDDTSYQRDDGQPSWQLVKIAKRGDVEAALGSDQERSAASGDPKDEDIF